MINLDPGESNKPVPTGATYKFLTNIFLYASMSRAEDDEDDEDDATGSTEPIRPDGMNNFDQSRALGQTWDEARG